MEETKERTIYDWLSLNISLYNWSYTELCEVLDYKSISGLKYALEKQTLGLKKVQMLADYYGIRDDFERFLGISGETYSQLLDKIPPSEILVYILKNKTKFEKESLFADLGKIITN